VSFENVKEKVKEVLRRAGCLVIVGPPGCGKSYAVQKAGEEMGYEVVELDSSELNPDHFAKVIATKGLKPSVIVVDVVDYLYPSDQAKLFRAMKKRAVPVIFTAHSRYSLCDEAETCEVVSMFRPDVRELSKYVNQKAKEVGLKPNYQALNSRDWRQAILSLYGSEGYSLEESVAKAVEQFFRVGRLEGADPSTLITIADNVSHFYGIYAYLLLKYVALADMSKRPEPLEALGEVVKGRVAKPKPSYALEKLRVAKEGRIF